MSTVLKRTSAGKAHDHAVAMGDAEPSLIAKIVLYDHEAITDPVDIDDITELTGMVLEITDFAQLSVNDTATRLHKTLDETVELTATGIAVQLENGIIKAYAPYLPTKGGLEKDTDYLWDIDIIIAEEDGADVIVRYEPFDLREMRERLLESFTSDANETLTLLIQTEVEKYLCAGIQAPALGQDPDCNQEPA